MILTEKSLNIINNFGYKQLVALLTTLELDIGQEILDEIKEDTSNIKNEKLLQLVRDKYFQDNRYNLTYHIEPSNNYHRLQKDIGKYIFLEIDGIKKPLTNKEYTNLLHQYNKIIGIKPISNIKIIQKRL